MKYKNLAFLFCIFLISQVFAQVKFEKFDLNNNNKLIFSVKHSPIVESEYEALFYMSLDEKINQSTINSEKNNPKLLTCYPEKLEILKEANIFQFRNRYGTALYDVKQDSLNWVKRSAEIEKSSTAFIPVYHNRLPPLSVSPDGKYIFYIEQTSAAKGKLVVKSLETNSVLVVASDIEYGYDFVPVKWSSDSSIAIYENKGNLFFYNFKDAKFSKQLPEKYRSIGVGSINNVYWADENLLMYINHDLVYSISSTELYTRALYSDLIGTGRIVGRLPSPFVPSDDKFWTSVDGKSIVLLQDNRTLWYMELSGTDFNFVTTLFSYPFVTVPGTALNFNVFWANAKSGNVIQYPIVWLEMLRDGKSESYVYKLIRDNEGKQAYFESLPLSVLAHNPQLSPDKKYLSFVCEKNFNVYDLSTWTSKFVFNEEEISSYSWINNSSILLGGNETVRVWNCVVNSSKILFLSQATRFGWDGESDTVLASNSFGYFAYNQNSGVWKKASNNIFRPQSTRNSKWRVFIDRSSNDAFENTLYGRELNAESYNIPLFEQCTEISAYNKPKVALTFDALDNADGLTPILSSLNRYGIKSTFFINGEFVRRFPTGVNEIIKAGHQCGSMFFSPYSLDDDAFKFTETFIRRGLARNEDDFYELTGSELSLVWHMPSYYLTDSILKAGEKSGYIWIDKGLAPEDYITYEKSLEDEIQYMSTSQIIDYLMENLEPGAIIPISVGIASGTRGDYLYDKLDVLISAILSEGYEIVTVSELFNLE